MFALLIYCLLAPLVFIAGIISLYVLAEWADTFGTEFHHNRDNNEPLTRSIVRAATQFHRDGLERINHTPAPHLTLIKGDREHR